MSPGVALKETTSWTVYIRVIPFPIPRFRLSHRSHFFRFTPGLDMEFSREQKVFVEVVQVWHVTRTLPDLSPGQLRSRQNSASARRGGDLFFFFFCEAFQRRGGASLRKQGCANDRRIGGRKWVLDPLVLFPGNWLFLL